MNTQTPPSNRSSWLWITAGVAVGANSTAGVLSARVTGSAWAQSHSPTSSSRMISQPSAESLTELHNLDTSFANLAEFVGPAVVDIKAMSGRAQDETGARTPQRGSEGSGFIFRADGYIITNDHVVGDSKTVTVTLKDGREFKGDVTRAQDSDLAIVKIQASGLSTLAFADTGKLRTGQLVMACGAPFGMQQSVSFGHVSALNRTSEVPTESNPYAPSASMQPAFRLYPVLIQTDTPINMGNSGGPLVDVDGRVVGVNTLIYSSTGLNAGIGFAIPANQVKFIADQLVSKGKISRAMLGLIPLDLKEYQLAEMKLAGGALVDGVSPDSPAAKAGIKKGDIIVRIGNTPVKSQIDLRNSMLVNAAGSTVDVELIREKEHKTVSVKLVEYAQPMVAQQKPNGLSTPPEDLDLFRSFPELRRRRNGGDLPNTDSKSHTGSPKLGVQTADPAADTRGEFSIPSGTSGAVIMTVEPGSVADANDIQPGDVIQSVGSQSIKNAQDLVAALKGLKWGDSRHVKFTRFGKNTVMTQERDIVFK